MTEEKINIAVKCPNASCDALISFRKKVSLRHIEINCPQCKKKIAIDFNINEIPQTFKSMVLSQSENDSELDALVNKAKKDTIYGKDRNKTPHSNQLDDYSDDEQCDEPIKLSRNRVRLKEKIYITHLRYFGLVKDKYKLSEGKTTIGRADDELPSDISLKGDETISRQSIVISIESDEYGFDYKLRVKNATNIVKVNDRKVKVGEEVFLEFGDIIKLGNSKLIFDNK